MSDVCVPCKYFPAKFGSFRSTRSHERREHKPLYAKEAEERKPPPSDEELYPILARIEAANKTGIFMEERTRATGLSVDQVRYRRKKSEYRAHLEAAKRAMRRTPTNHNERPSIIADSLPEPMKEKEDDLSPATQATAPGATAAIRKDPDSPPATGSKRPRTKLDAERQVSGAPRQHYPPSCAESPANQTQDLPPARARGRDRTSLPLQRAQNDQPASWNQWLAHLGNVRRKRPPTNP